MTLRACCATCTLLLLLSPLALAQKSGAGMGTVKLGGAPSPALLAARIGRAAFLPDSVLARVPGRPDITVERFRQTLAKLGTAADSITPKQRREFLGLLVEQQLLAARVANERWAWSARDSGQWLALRDRLVLDAVLDSALRETALRRARAGQEPIEDRGALGVAARESAMVWLAPRYNDALVARVAAAFDSLPKRDANMTLGEQLRVAGMLPQVAAADSAGSLAESRVGRYTVPQLLTAWRKLNPLYRPRIEGVAAVRELVQNGLFERHLREQAEANRLLEHPQVVEALTSRAELIEVSMFVQREVYEKIARDSLTLQKYFRGSGHEFDVPAHARIVRLVLPTQAAAATMVQRLRDAAEAESLAVRSRRQGADFAALITAQSDSGLYARARRAGVGAVLGPDSTLEGWRVVRVSELKPARARTFDEARTLVTKAWVDHEAERRMQALLDDLKRRSPVLVNERVLARRGLPGVKAGQ